MALWRNSCFKNPLLLMHMQEQLPRLAGNALGNLKSPCGESKYALFVSIICLSIT